LFSITTLRALHALASLPEDGNLTKGKELASRLNFPAPSLAKSLKALAKGRILNSIRGPNGGFILARPAHRITVMEILEALKAPNPLPDCALGHSMCRMTERPCSFHVPWSQFKAKMETILTTLTLRDLYLIGVQRLQASTGESQQTLPRIVQDSLCSGSGARFLRESRAPCHGGKVGTRTHRADAMGVGPELVAAISIAG
jgi:Rrf2 family transcriptional regulator, iron-sulfur cluster assembly transcription factor